MILCQNLVQLVCCNTTVNIIIDGENRSQTAGTDTTAGIQREQPVVCALATLDAPFFFQFVINIAAALHITSGTQTNADGVFALGIERKL